MGNTESHHIQGESVKAKLENGGPNGHVVNIAFKDTGEVVPCEAAVQQNSELPSTLPTKEATLPSGDEVDGGRNHGKGPRPKSVVLLSFSKTVSPNTDAPEDPSWEPVSVKSSAEEETSTQNLLKRAPEITPTVPAPAPKDEEPKKSMENKVNFFDKVFKKKKEGIEKEPTVVECNEDQEPPVQAPVILTNGFHSEPGDVEGSTTVGKVPEGLSPNGTPAGSIALDFNGESSHLVDTNEGESIAEESSVMNFFKTLVTPSKTPKEEGAPPAVSTDEAKGSGEPEEKAKAEASPAVQPAGPLTAEPKASDPPVKGSVGLTVVSPFSKLFRSKQSSKDAKPATTTKIILEVDESTAAKAPKPPPPPPPPEPPKLESKGASAGKNVNSTQKETAKDAAKEPEAPTKQKPAKGSPFLKLFNLKTGDSKAKATDVPVPPGQPPKQEKKLGKANLISLFKSKVLQHPQVSLVQAASTCGNNIPASSDVLTPDTKAKESTSPTATAFHVDATQSMPAKAGTMPALEVEKKRDGKQEGTPMDGKSISEASQIGEDGTSSLTRKMEKRNSIHMFFKSLGPKRQSDAGVQTDPVTITYPAEKAK
ncbi:hypothetical protein AAFF_G00091190 [Aldrovandia affinis]|uniref:Breast carcinoma-amplified sequence 1 n=1 Tax=Aldrovandia affinis TaxID=143900 RepID=A0AAD7WBU3_9TELE|nr:hypothetical protein AAFF_G00091190 [Aldrovandia affinis]